MPARFPWALVTGSFPPGEPDGLRAPSSSAGFDLQQASYPALGSLAHAIYFIVVTPSKIPSAVLM